ncbi:class I adenylate-forming enzyme family protein [Sphingopyxis yananensis]|uniref:class I adenylate-forming enzyme family protein n=1 Tax=Sphingopyxis yananensis TaxID=2886687 RepID=UPI001D109052|nr:AMP-binding protein [Sphingopyxis yananensis]MCC2601969.1 AMP-binding protein [Sphingopyxis yananensis]
MAQTLSSALAWWARMRPTQPAVILGGDRLTYGEYKAWSDRVAAMLEADGLQAGDRVAICSTNSLAYCALVMGVIRAGGIVNPVNFRFTAREIRELCETTQPRFTFAAPEFEANVQAAGLVSRSMAQVEELRTGGVLVPLHDPQPDAPVVIIATSGSTAKPKGVVYTNRSMTAYAACWALEETSSSPGARVISLAPLNTSAGFVQLIHYTTQGCTVYMEPSFVPEAILQLLQDEKINCFGAVPTFFEAIARCPGFGEADLSAIRLATAGGARVSRQLLDIWKAKGVTIRQIYGQTEVGGNVTMMPEHLAMEEPEKCGWGNIFMEVRVLRPDGSACEPGEAGEIVMRSPGMMTGYWRNEEETAKAIRDGWLWSGDIGTMDERGLLTFVDRLKDLIISGGLNISAAEIERVVCEFDGVDEALAIAAPDPKFGETPFIIYHGAAEVDVAALIAHCNANLSNYKVPRYVVYSAEPLPRLATGKLSKPAVRERYADAHQQLERVR